MLKILNWGSIPYKEALSRQQAAVREVQSGGTDVLILCEHPLTITLGRKAHLTNLYLSEEALESRGFSVVAIDRGGDVTLHAPGQLVVYPVIDLRRKGLGLKGYLHQLEKTAVDLLADFGIVAAGDDGNRGVWVGPRKIASIGIAVSRWVTYHGMAINVNNDLTMFQVMRPCGLDVRMTSLSAELGRQVSMEKVMERYEYYCSRSW